MAVSSKDLNLFFPEKKINQKGMSTSTHLPE